MEKKVYHVFPNINHDIPTTEKMNTTILQIPGQLTHQSYVSILVGPDNDNTAFE